jgi:CRP-like cAMP-binding protein
VRLDDEVLRLGRTRPFDLLPREAVQLIAFSCEKRRLRAGEALFFAGEAADSGYFVHSGAIILVVDGATEPKAERRVGPGALIGEGALYAPTARRVSARAAEDAVVMRISHETFRRVLTEFPAGAEKIRAVLAARTRRLVDGLEATRIKSFEGPLASRPRAAQ